MPKLDETRKFKETQQATSKLDTNKFTKIKLLKFSDLQNFISGKGKNCTAKRTKSSIQIKEKEISQETVKYGH